MYRHYPLMCQSHHLHLLFILVDLNRPLHLYQRMAQQRLLLLCPSHQRSIKRIMIGIINKQPLQLSKQPFQGKFLHFYKTKSGMLLTSFRLLENYFSYMRPYPLPLNNPAARLMLNTSNKRLPLINNSRLNISNSCCSNNRNKHYSINMLYHISSHLILVLYSTELLLGRRQQRSMGQQGLLKQQAAIISGQMNLTLNSSIVSNSIYSNSNNSSSSSSSNLKYILIALHILKAYRNLSVG